MTASGLHAPAHDNAATWWTSPAKATGTSSRPPSSRVRAVATTSAASGADGSSSTAAAGGSARCQLAQERVEDVGGRARDQGRLGEAAQRRMCDMRSGTGGDGQGRRTFGRTAEVLYRPVRPRA